MLKESIIFVMLILFSIEDIRKRRIDVLPLLVFLVIGILYQAITRSLTIPGNLWRRILGSVFARNRQSDR